MRDCNYINIYVVNKSYQRFFGSLRVVEVGGDGNDEEENEVFSDSFRLTTSQGKKYDDLPDRDGRYRIHVDLEDGPSGTEEVHSYAWEENRLIQVNIRSDSIEFRYSHVDGC